MHKFKLSNLGWVVAAALAGVMLGGGFQPETLKIGVVDISHVIEKSDYGKASQETFAQMKAAREGLLEFLDQNRVATADQVKQLKEYSLKEKPTAEDKAALDALKKVIATAKENSERLAQKKNPTEEDVKLMAEYNQRSQAIDAQTQQLYRQFTGEMQAWADKQKNASIEKARGAISDAAKAQGFTIVFEVGVAPYGANDLTDAALKAMNARK